MKAELRPEVGVAAGSWVMVGEHRALQCLDAGWLRPAPCSTVPAVAAGVQTGNVAEPVTRALGKAQGVQVDAELQIMASYESRGRGWLTRCVSCGA